MKTSIEMADALFLEAKKAAERDGTTLKALVEAGLRQVLAERQHKAQPFRLRRASYKDKSLRAELEAASCERLRTGVRGARRVIALDTNLLVDAHREDSPFHEAARECIVR